MLEELGLEFEHRPFEHDDPRLKSAQFLEQNPAGAIPTLIDDGIVVAESMAINEYLASTYSRATGIAPAGNAEEIEARRWALWAQGHLEPWVSYDPLPPAVAESLDTHRNEILSKPLALLNRVTGGRQWLLGSRFTVADLNVAACLSPSRASRIHWESWPSARDWLDRCYARDAATIVRQRWS